MSQKALEDVILKWKTTLQAYAAYDIQMKLIFTTQNPCHAT
jgi:hypothetical protein